MARLTIFERTNGTGHLDQRRFSSFPIQCDEHLLIAMWYVERSSVRANFIKLAEDWVWGSAHTQRHAEDQHRQHRWLATPADPPLPRQWRSWVEHTGPAFRQAIDALRGAVQKYGLLEVLVAVERTGNYHRPVQRAFRSAGLETRVVHPFASYHFRQVEHPGNKTDDHDLAGIHRAIVVGFGLLELPLDETFIHRRDLVRKVAALHSQIREHLHSTLPGFTALFQAL